MGAASQASAEHFEQGPATYKWLVAIAVMLGTTLEVLDTSIVNVALPHMQGSFSASVDEIAWVLTSYLVANGIMIPMTGWISARFGRKRYFLTSVAVPIAREHKMLLIDQTGTGAAFFSKDNPYIVLMSDPVSTIWPKYIADFLTTDGVKLGIKRIALLYSTNDFTGTQANAVRGFIKAANAPVTIVYDQGVPTNTTSYTVIINNIRAANPDAVIALGYPNNDISYLRNLEDSGVKFNWQFAIYPGLETEHLEKTVGVKGLEDVYTYTPSSVLEYKAEFGMSLPQFRAAWDKKYGEGKVAFGFNSVAGYTTGLVLQKALAGTASMDQLALRRAIFGLSGKLKTIDGTFELNGEGAQIGEITPLGQIVPDGKGGLKFVVVYPHDAATGKPVYPAPKR